MINQNQENNIMEIDPQKAIIEGAISQYSRNIVEKLLNGESVYINGLGTLDISYRRVKSRGRDYSLRVRVTQDLEFNKKLIENFENDRENFIKGKNRRS